MKRKAIIIKVVNATLIADAAVKIKEVKNEKRIFYNFGIFSGVSYCMLLRK